MNTSKVNELAAVTKAVTLAYGFIFTLKKKTGSSQMLLDRANDTMTNQILNQ